jgi:hypothetical protein
MSEVEYMRLKNDILDIESPAPARKANITGENGYTGPFTMRKQIGATSYEVAVYYSRKNRESLEEKIIRLVRNEALNAGADR